MKAKHTPNSNSPLLSEEYFQKCLEEVFSHDISWTLSTQDKGTTLYSKSNTSGNESPAVAQRQEFKFVSHFKRNYLDLFETLRDVTIRKVAAKANLADIKWIENHEADRHDVVYVLTTTPNSWVVSQREMLTARAWNYFTDDDGLDFVIMVEKFTERDDVPPSDTHVRAKVLFQVCMFKQCPKNPETECDWTLITVMDIGGWVPTWVMDWLVQLAPDSVAKEMEGGFMELIRVRSQQALDQPAQ